MKNCRPDVGNGVRFVVFGATSEGCDEVNDKGEVEAAASGPVPACLPQTSQAGEYAALAAAENLITGESRLFGDCQNVVKDWHKDSQ